jgi:hypothetical protein
MQSRDDKKIKADALRERMNRLGQKAKAASVQEAKATSSKSMVRLDHSRLLKIETDNSIVEQIAMADVITARTHSNEREERLFTRPKAELEAPGLPYEIQTLNFSVPSVKDLRYLAQVIGRMKQKA